MKQLLISALEPSANLHLKSLTPYFKGVKLSGIFEEEIGVSPIVSSKDFGVMGIFAVIPKLILAYKSMSKMVALAKNSDTILLIDAPAFNLPLAKKIKTKYPEKKIIYFILPKVWIWKKGRIADIEKYTDIQISIFPFEKQFFQHSFYFGNPLISQISYHRQAILKNGTIAFLPGSRKNEIKNLMPIFQEMAKKVKKALLVIPPVFNDFKIYGDISNFTILRNSEEALKISEFAFICSGTATLEASIIGIPFILVYKTSSIEYWIGKKILNIKYIGLANIIFEKSGIQEEFHKEILQNLNSTELLAEMQQTNKYLFIKNSKIMRQLLAGASYSAIAEIIQNSQM